MDLLQQIDISSWEFLSPAIIAGWAVIIVSLERLFPYKPQKFFRKGFWMDLVLYTLVQSYVLGFVVNGTIRWLDDHTAFETWSVVGDWPIWVQLLFFIVTHDLYIYLMHRAQHSNKVLWRTHEAHHSVEDVDWVAGSRSHAIEIVVNGIVEFAPIALLGAAPEVWLMKATVSATWGMWIHSNIDVKTGWLQKIINGPEMHRWHHAKDMPHPAVNFATKLAFWDWILGTAYLPKHKLEGYGLWGDPAYPQNYIGQFFACFRPFKGDAVLEAADAYAHEQGTLASAAPQVDIPAE